MRSAHRETKRRREEEDHLEQGQQRLVLAVHACDSAAVPHAHALAALTLHLRARADEVEHRPPEFDVQLADHERKGDRAQADHDGRDDV